MNANHYCKQMMLTTFELSLFQVPGNGSPASYIDQAHKEKALQSMQQMSSAQIVSATAMHSKSLSLPPGVSSLSIKSRPLVVALFSSFRFLTLLLLMGVGFGSLDSNTVYHKSKMMMAISISID